MTKASQSFAPALVDTAPEIPAIELPLLRQMEERAGERRHVWVEEVAIFHQNGAPSHTPWWWACHYPHLAPAENESQRDSVTEPRVARYNPFGIGTRLAQLFVERDRENAQL